MKPKRPRPTPRELWLIFAPFPLLWLYLGAFVHPAVFTFWRAGQSIDSLTAMTLGWVPLCFTFSTARQSPLRADMGQ